MNGSYHEILLSFVDAIDKTKNKMTDASSLAVLGVLAVTSSPLMREPMDPVRRVARTIATVLRASRALCSVSRGCAVRLDDAGPGLDTAHIRWRELGRQAGK